MPCYFLFSNFYDEDNLKIQNIFCSLEDSPISDLVLNSEDSWLRPNPTVVLPAQSVRQTT